MSKLDKLIDIALDNGPPVLITLECLLRKRELRFKIPRKLKKKQRKLILGRMKESGFVGKLYFDRYRKWTTIISKRRLNE